MRCAKNKEEAKKKLKRRSRRASRQLSDEVDYNDLAIAPNRQLDHILDDLELAYPKERDKDRERLSRSKPERSVSLHAVTSMRITSYPDKEFDGTLPGFQAKQAKQKIGRKFD